ncbi:large conductance mechanosensitive channel protein MscL [Corynebacterium sp. ES2794-CONJ1]|uniref:large conductance mechanosensitive channel protein MscL n=1 Tax=unclassified Corynebacterium TaxID=2624378 RepID=UPI002166CBF0|nr:MULTISPECIES: large conductance mechanosensitive channel protein MscL [unclassified Corynebacterium]MCS4490013.1 large conductance mechanosensitive channel protein MscL [Corynebacterium sp. ES2775-CONJ]MCS4491624.1 large conductance mechanosensitive channel protein MscL [Corynebacterium sp. ES2715-CONJ3]MCS4531729.1 large conductance mechanosensitive channel protein MscL [Corynebacterium sp. ES2730-CONJ]MCU9519125.1 large conductance mechanosensitive channel protein MscL [Corynebacterium sp.
MFQGFKEFVLRSNVIELAVAVVVGGAVTGLVNAFSDSLISPVIAALGGADVSGLGFYLRPGNEASFLDFGAVITAGINFMIVASVVYFLVIVPMNKLSETLAKEKGVDQTSEAASIEVELLTEIRDLLSQERGTKSHP